MKGLHEDKSYHNLTVYREDVRVPPINGPYWTSNVNCVGTEDNLSQCDMVELGTVTSCENHHYAGVLCYDNEGMLTRTYIVEKDGNAESNIMAASTWFAEIIRIDNECEGQIGISVPRIIICHHEAMGGSRGGRPGGLKNLKWYRFP